MIEDASVPPASDSIRGNRIRVSDAPPWVVRAKVRNASRQAGAPVTDLLYDRQIHVPSKTSYSRHVSRLETPQAVQQLSRVEIPFDPQVQTITIHGIGIFRNGVITNHARIEDFEIMRREQRLDAGILNGELSALLLLKDVRTGDILDVEFSVADERGIFGDGLSWLQSVEQGHPVGDWKFVWIDEADRVPKILGNAEHLSYSETPSEGMMLRSWVASEIPAKKFEDNLPPDLFPVSVLQLSTFGGWGEIVAPLLERWNIDPASRVELDVELASIRSSAAGDSAKLIDAAVSAARDAVRYQAYSPGLLAMVPENLAKVWERRYGDCKEKTLLLCWLLRELGIDAVPVLVHSSIGKSLPQMLPGPGAFDHVVARVMHGGTELWIDATDLYRGGRPSAWIDLPFAWGLPLAPGSAELVKIPDAPAGASFLKVKERVKPDTRTRKVQMDLEIVTGGRKADWTRGLLDSHGMPGLQKFLKEYIETSRRGVEIDEDPDFQDDRGINEVTLRVKASIPKGVLQDPEHARDFVVLAPFSFAGALPVTENWNRRVPLNLGGLDRIEHEIEVDHPNVTKADFPRQTVKNPAFEVDAGSRMERGKPVFWFSCSTLADRVAPAALSRYKTAVERAYGILDVSLNLPGRAPKNAVDPEHRWGGGIPSPMAGRAGQARETMQIVKFVGIGLVILVFIVRIILILMK